MPRRPTSIHRDIDLHTLASLVTAERTYQNEAPAVARDPALPADQHVIAFFAASPPATQPLKLGDEWADIQRELKLAPFRDDFRLESRWAVTVDDVFRDLNQLDPVVIHFAGHGDASGLVLQDEHGNPEPVSPHALVKLVASAARKVRAVLFNACSTTAHAEALRAHADVIVAMSGKINDHAARMFAARFYGALGNRRSIGNAVKQGIAKLATKGLPDAALPQCVTRDGIDAFQVFLPPCERPHDVR